MIELKARFDEENNIEWSRRLEEAGYQVQILGFIDMEHTPKNILIRAVKTGKPHEIKELGACEKFLGVDPLLGRLRKEKGEM